MLCILDSNAQAKDVSAACTFLMQECWGVKPSSLVSHLCVVLIKILSKTDWLRLVFTQLLFFLMSFAAYVCL